MSQEENPTLDESSVTMLDVLNEEQALEEESLAVLGGSDDKFCTYSKVILSPIAFPGQF